MAILPILQYPDKRLAQRASEVTDLNAELKQIVADLFETHYAQDNCAALAATQLGIMKRITVIDFSDKKDEPLCLINPVYRPVRGTTNQPEGCMSVKGIYNKVKRHEVIHVTYQDVDGQEHTFEADGFMAKCIQHEIDHLDGILFIDRLSALRKTLITNKLRKIQKDSS